MNDPTVISLQPATVSSDATPPSQFAMELARLIEGMSDSHKQRICKFVRELGEPAADVPTPADPGSLRDRLSKLGSSTP